MRPKQLQKSNHLQSIDKVANKLQCHRYLNNGMASNCDFFTKQATLQIETRTALSQAKVMAARQIEVFGIM